MRTKIMDKKGFTVGDIPTLAIVLVVATIVVALGSTLLSDFQSDQTSSSYAYNTTGKGLEGMNKFGTYFPTIALIIVVAVIVGILVRYLMNR